MELRNYSLPDPKDPIKDQIMKLRIELGIETAHVPMCFDGELEYLQWVKAARSCNSELNSSGGHLEGYCTDCLPEFKDQMLCERRCSHPEVRFYKSQEGGIEGTRAKTTDKELI